MATIHTRREIATILSGSHLANSLPLNLISQIIDYVETKSIFFCSHKGSDLIAYNVHGDYLGTIVKADANDQWLTGFDFDAKGTLYVALYEGFLAKYPLPSDQSLYTISITPRNEDTLFENNINKTITSLSINSDSAAEGVIVIDNDEYQSVFVSCMEPIFGILQFSFDGVLQRVICPNLIDNAWSMKLIPSFFFKSSTSPFLKNRNLFMVSDRSTLRIVDIDLGEKGNIMCSLDFHLCQSGCIGDFTFMEPKKNDKALLIVNLQDGIIQFNQSEMFWKLKHVDINENIKYFKVLGDTKIEKIYGTCTGPDGDIYLCDHTAERIIKMKILDYDMILNVDKVSDDMDCNNIQIEIFCDGMESPNYSAWMDAERIGLNFVNFPIDVFGVEQE